MTSKFTKLLGTVILVHRADKILLGRRKGAYGAGSLGVPGGKIEPGEPILTSASRELTEETGLRDQHIEFVGVVREWQGTNEYIHFVFACEPTEEPRSTEPDKNEGWQWHDLENPPADILRGHRAAIDLWTSKQPLLDLPA
jgi:8-oxo-dGTP diphosphatase